jgi:large subunit ribosomal protein L24
MMKFKIGDTVKITSGKDKGREGKIERIFSKEGKILIPTVNLFKKHVKGMGERKSGIYDIPRPLPFSQIALICPKCKKPTRVGFRVLEKEKVRICRKCRKEIETK